MRRMRLLATSIAAASLLVPSLASAQMPPAPNVAPAAPYAAPYAPPYGFWAPYPQAPVTERRSKGMMITGIAMWGAAGVATGVGMGLFLTSVGSVCAFADGGAPGGLSASPRASFKTASAGERVGSARQAFSSCTGNPDVGFGIMSAGIISSFVAIPLFVVGNSRVPARPHDDLASAPTLRLGLGNASISWQF
jgi:hypothetical protein